jgi:3-phosphoshikimate 1-carboxyvinyltransferase
MLIVASHRSPLPRSYKAALTRRIIHLSFMPRRCIEPAKGPLQGDFRAIPSKSATHRALVVASIAHGRSEIRGPLDADDTRRTLSGLRALGVHVEEGQGVWSVDGAGGRIPGGGSVALGASGSSARFLTALAAVGSASSVLDGSPRLRERPMEELVLALERLGASIRTAEGCRLPIRTGGAPVRGGDVEVSAARSSQFASALLLVAATFEGGLRLVVPPPRVSFSYVRLTVEMLEAFGGTVERSGDAQFALPPQRLAAAKVEIEGDHSAASYLLAAVAILGGRVRVRGLRVDSAQPDARFLRDLASLGCVVEDDPGGIAVTATGQLTPFAWDLGDAPDLAPTAAVLALFADGPSRLSGLGHLRHKESDRLAVLADNLARLGAKTSIDGGSLSVDPPPRGSLRGAPLGVAHDHRIAMAFGVAGLAVAGIELDDCDAVTKSYPAFWDDLARLVRTES